LAYCRAPGSNHLETARRKSEFGIGRQNLFAPPWLALFLVAASAQQQEKTAKLWPSLISGDYFFGLRYLVTRTGNEMPTLKVYRQFSVMIHRHGSPLESNRGIGMATANERSAGRKRQRALDRRALKTMKRIIHHLYDSNGYYKDHRKGWESDAIKWCDVIEAVRSN
jgi:hypothetical protein